MLIVYSYNYAYSLSPNRQCRALVGILIPMEKESRYLRQQIENKQEVILSGIHYIRGDVNGHSIVFAQTGVGKINAATVTTRLIQDFHPDLILMSGSAGSIDRTLSTGNVVIGKQVIDADLGQLTNHGPEVRPHLLFNSNINRIVPAVFTLKPVLLSIVKNIKDDSKIPKTKIGRIATSDNTPNSLIQITKLEKDLIDVVEMEGASLMHVWYFFDVPCVVIRAVSDVADKASIHRIEYAGINAAKVLLHIIQKSNMCNLDEID